MNKLNATLSALIVASALTGCVAGAPATIAFLDDSELKDQTTENLCQAYAFNNSRNPRLKAEVDRRGGFTAADWALIDKSQVVIGMSEIKVRCSWGRPFDVHKTTTAYGAREQWVYRGGAYLYMTNGVLSAMQN